MTSYPHDIFAADAIRVPHPHYEGMRALAPIVWLEATGCWATTSYAAAEEVLSQPELYVSGKGVSLNEKFNKLLVGNTLNSDGNEHSQRKKVSIKPLLPATLKPLEPIIQSASDQLVKELPERVEAVSQIAQHLPLNIVVDLVGLPENKKGEMLSWGAAAFDFLGPDNAQARSQSPVLKSMRDFISHPDVNEQLSPDGWAAALHYAEQQGKIPEGWAVEQMRDYLNPSLDTTIAATAFGLHLFADVPEEWQKLRQNPDLIPNAIEEIVRLSSPIRGLSRYVVQDCQLCGQNLKQGDRVFVLFAAANRDPAVFEKPNRFDIQRRTAPHMGFGKGIHFCLGMRLARMEMSCLLLSLIKRVRTIERDGNEEFGLNNIIYGLKKLPLRFEFDH